MRAVLGLVGAARARILSAEIFVRAVAPPAPDVAVPTVVRSHLLSQKEFQTTLNWRLTAAQSCLSQSGAAGAHDEQGRIPHPLPDQLIRPDGTLVKYRLHPTCGIGLKASDVHVAQAFVHRVQHGAVGMIPRVA